MTNRRPSTAAAAPSPAALDANALELLARVVAAGSFAQAARELGVTRAAVSHRVAVIESLAGAPLFVRSTRSLGLTAAGRQLAQRARAVAEATEAARRALRRRSSQGLEGSLRVTTFPMLAQTVLAPVLARFQADNPGLLMELRLTHRRIDLLHEDVDVALRYTARPPADWVAQPLFGLKILAYGAPAARLALAGPEALAGCRCLVFGDSTAASPLRWRHADGRRCEVRIEPAVQADDMATLLAMACHGGVVFAPDFAAAAHVRRGELLDVLPGWRLEGGEAEQIQALTLPTPVAPGAARALVRYLRAELAGAG